MIRKLYTKLLFANFTHLFQNVIAHYPHRNLSKQAHSSYIDCFIVTQIKIDLIVQVSLSPPLLNEKI